jgi:hypothetical protein
MKSKTLITLLMLIIILFNSCKKESLKTSEHCDIETYNYNSFPIGAESCFMNITSLDSTIKVNAPPRENRLKGLDIDNDGYHDFEIYSNHPYTLGGIRLLRSSIKVMDSTIFISTIEMTDTVYRCLNISNNIVTYYNNFSTFSCDGDGIDSLYSTDNFSYPKIYSIGESLMNNETWKNDIFTLSFYDFSFKSFNIPRLSYDIIRGNWHNQNMKYILFKKVNSDKTIYGWLKVSVNNYKEIQVHEYAIQK